jgi:hypothetical protein
MDVSGCVYTDLVLVVAYQFRFKKFGSCLGSFFARFRNKFPSASDPPKNTHAIGRLFARASQKGEIYPSSEAVHSPILGFLA